MVKTPESAVTINLKDGINEQERKTLNLSDEQFDSFKEHLKQKKSKEKLGIIELTTEELKELNAAITDTNDNNYEFTLLERQLAEITTTSELMAGTKIEELLNKIDIDSVSYKMLFGEKGILKKHLDKLGFDEEVKRNMASGLSLLMLEQLNNGLKKDGSIINQFIGLLKGNDNSDFLTKIPFISEIQGKINDDDFIKQIGENDLLHTLQATKDPIVWKNIMNAILKGGNINNATKKGNEIDSIKELGNQLGENKEIKKIMYIMEKGGDFSAKISALEPNKIEMIKKVLSKLGGFGDFIIMILELFGIDLDSCLNNSYTRKIKDAFDNFDTTDFNSIVIKESMLDKEFYKNLGNKKYKITDKLKQIAVLEEIDGEFYEEDFLLSLFKKDGPFGKDIIKDNKVNFSKLKDALDAYIKSITPKEEKEKKAEEDKDAAT